MWYGNTVSRKKANESLFQMFDLPAKPTTYNKLKAVSYHFLAS